MIIGIPKEIKDQEFRVGITPVGVAALCQEGHTLIVESGAGEGSDLSDTDYQNKGAEIASSKRALFQNAEMIIKVKEPLPEEFEFFHAEQILLTYLHLAADRTLLNFLLEKKITAIAYETIESEDGKRPLLKPMSEVAGRMAVLLGARFLTKTEGGCGVLLSGVAGVEKGKVTVIGGGIVGKNAAQVALALGAEVTIFEENSAQRSYLDDHFKGAVVTLPPYPDMLATSLKNSHLVIGAVSVTGDKAPHLVTRKMISEMCKGSVVVDVAIDQGGCFETARKTSHSDPVYVVDDVIHYCVANIPGVVPKTATFALSNETFPYIQKIATLGFEAATTSDPGLKKGVNVHAGKITYSAVAEAFNLAMES
ncbi:MAG: alanine dehydrogenase [Nitrospirota bacterium]|nr:alanine dehydrogenase [Nitrospirota bacterium]